MRPQLMHLLHDRDGVPRPVEEIGIAKRDVPRARLHLLLDVFHHDLARHDAELPAVHRHDGAMAAVMLAAAARFGVAAHARALPIDANEIRVLAQMRQRVPIGQDEVLSGERDDRFGLAPSLRASVCEECRRPTKQSPSCYD